MWFELELLLKGVIIGFSVAAPVGPIGLLCIQRTLTQGRVSGWVSGLGAATADAVYGIIAGFGITLISGLLLEQQEWIRLVGGCLLLYLGAKSMMSQPAKQAAQAKHHGLFWSYISTFLLTITNPMTILFFLAVFTSVGAVQSTHHFLGSLLVVLGVLVGSTMWWLMLSLGVGLVKKQINSSIQLWISRLSGLTIIAFGIYGIIGAGFGS